MNRYWAVLDRDGFIARDGDALAIGERKWSKRCVRVEVRQVDNLIDHPDP